MSKNICDMGEQICPMVLLIKDHKGWSPEMNTPLPSRPVVSGNCGLNSHLSELISLVMEPVTNEASGHEIESTTEMLHRISELNKRLASSKCDNGSSRNDENPLSFESNEDVSLTTNLFVDAAKQAEAELPMKISNKEAVVRPKSGIRSYGMLGSKTDNNR